MTYAQLRNNIIENVIVLDDASKLDLFRANPVTSEAYDMVIRVDSLEIQPGIGWALNTNVWDTITGWFGISIEPKFTPPPQAVEEE